MSRTKVRFIDGSNSLVVCEIEAALQHALSQELKLHLETLGLVIVHSETRLNRDRLLQRVHIAGRDGGPVDETRRLQLQALLLTLAATGSSEFPAAAENVPK